MSKTLVVDNFRGSMTPIINGDINSGLTNVVEVFGHDPFSSPRRLTWYEAAVQIDAQESVITDLVLAGKVRVESGVNYVYAVGHTGRLYKIQVNDPTSYNPNYDNPVLLATLTAQSPTFKKGGFIDFFGSTERIYIGHDKGVTRINFDGTSETFVGTLGSYTQNVPRPLQQFLGKLYFGNGENIGEIDSTATVSTYTKLSPALPKGTQVRDIDIVPSGTYIQIVATTLGLSDITSTTVDTAITSPADSFIFFWNGTDAGYTNFTTHPKVVFSANAVWDDKQYVFGYDFLGGGVYIPGGKFLTSAPVSAFGESPLPGGVFSSANIIFWATPLPFNGHLEMLLTMFGTTSNYEVEPGYYAPYSQTATGDETDVLRVPFAALVSNWAQGASFNGYTNQIFGEPKMYFSTLETSASPTTKYKLFKLSLAPTGLGEALEGAVYQTQQQLFSKKVSVREVRVYGEPWATDNAFTVDLIGSDNSPISGGTKSFVAGTNLVVGDDFAWYTPDCGPVYSLGLRITNDGVANHIINKVEIDYDIGGK